MSLNESELDNIEDVLRKNLPDKSGITQLGLLLYSHMKTKNEALINLVLKLSNCVDLSLFDDETRAAVVALQPKEAISE